MKDKREGKSGENMPLKAVTHVMYSLCMRVCFHLFRLNTKVERLSYMIGLYLTSLKSAKMVSKGRIML